MGGCEGGGAEGVVIFCCICTSRQPSYQHSRSFHFQFLCSSTVRDNPLLSPPTHC